MAESEAHCSDLDHHLSLAEYCAERCRKLKDIHGASKLERRFLSEIKFLRNLKKKTPDSLHSHLKSSNLNHYAAILHASETLPDVSHILQSFSCPDRSENLTVDVVACKGHCWVKVIARKAQALHLIWAGQGQFGERDLVRHAEEYTDCTKHHPCDFQNPQLHFAFYNEVTREMAEALEQLGVTVWGQRSDVSEEVQNKLKLGQDEDDAFWSGGSGDFDDDISPGDPNFREFLCSAKEQIRDLYSCDNDDENNSCDTTSEEKNKCDKICDNDSKNSTSASFVSSNADDDRRQVSGQNSVDERDGSLNSSSQSTELTHAVQGISLSATCSADLSDRVDVRSDVVSDSHSDLSSAPCDCADEELNLSSEISSENSGGASSLSPSLRKRHNSNSHVAMLCALFGAVPDFNSFPGGASLHGVVTASDIQKINLDVSSLLTLVAAVSHGRCNFIFKEKILTQQAKEERSCPVLPRMLRFMEGKQLYTCQTALDSFNSILDILGGPFEKQEASKLVDTVSVVPDGMSQRTKDLPLSGKLKKRAKIIFGTGDALQAVTMTSNAGFVRAAQNQGIVFSVFLHQARALTEMKEPEATPVPT